MGLASELGYEYPDSNWFHRQVHAFFATRIGARIGRRLVPAVDKMISKLTGGRSSVSRLLGALPVLWVTVKGARSGIQRTFPVYGVPFDGDLALIGSHFGQPRHPAWAHNLEANPEVSVEHGGLVEKAVARRATEDEEERIWATATELYHGYARYRHRVTTRRIKVFVLEHRK